MKKEKQKDFGIKGANPACWIMAKEERYCDICLKYIPKNYIECGQPGYNFGKDDNLRMFHYIGSMFKDGRPCDIMPMKDHIAVCNKCLNKIPDGYWGCGCGG